VLDALHADVPFIDDIESLNGTLTPIAVYCAISRCILLSTFYQSPWINTLPRALVKFGRQNVTGKCGVRVRFRVGFGFDSAIYLLYSTLHILPVVLVKCDWPSTFHRRV